MSNSFDLQRDPYLRKMWRLDKHGSKKAGRERYQCRVYLMGEYHYLGGYFTANECEQVGTEFLDRYYATDQFWRPTNGEWHIVGEKKGDSGRTQRPYFNTGGVYSSRLLDPEVYAQRKMVVGINGKMVRRTI